jgi:hypothetical protein
VAVSLTVATLWLVSSIGFGSLIFLATSRYLRLPRSLRQAARADWVGPA